MYEKSKKAMIYIFRTPPCKEGCVLALTSPRFIYRVIVVVGTQPDSDGSIQTEKISGIIF